MNLRESVKSGEVEMNNSSGKPKRHQDGSFKNRTQSQRARQHAFHLQNGPSPTTSGAKVSRQHTEAQFQTPTEPAKHHHQTTRHYRSSTTTTTPPSLTTAATTSSSQLTTTTSLQSPTPMRPTIMTTTPTKMRRMMKAPIPRPTSTTILTLANTTPTTTTNAAPTAMTTTATRPTNYENDNDTYDNNRQRQKSGQSEQLPQSHFT
jgi:hypothetical protein